MHNKILSRRNFQSLALVPAATCRLWLQSIALLLGLLAAGAARGQNCEFYPIAVPAATLNNAAPGTILTNLFNGTQPGNFGWLTWAGSPSELTLVRSLTPPSDSAAYVNPDNPNDHQLNVGDWVQGKPAVSNARTVQAALDQLEQLEIIVPVWNQTRGQGENAAYRLSAFARIQLLGYQLPGQNRITARFLGYATCDAQNLPPTVDAGPDQTITLPSTAPLNGTAIDDGLPIGGALTASWSVASGAGTVTFANPNSAATTASFSAAGTYVLRLTATDSQLANDDEVIITVNRENHPPVAFGLSLTNLEDAALDIVLAGSDPDDDPLSFLVVASPNHGTLTGVPPDVRYTPLPDYNGLDSFTFKVNDGLLDSDAATVAITNAPVNDSPVADSQSLTTLEDTPLVISLSGTDVEGSALTFTVVNAPTHGTLSGFADQRTYTPTTHYHGPDSFTFKLNDGELDSAVATVAIEVVSVNNAPLVDAGPDCLISLPINTVTLAGTVSDDNFDGASLAVEWSAVTGPGTVTFADLFATNTMATFSVPGIYLLRLTAEDSSLAASDDVLVTVNAPPTVSAGANQAIIFPDSLILNGEARDDGLPTDGAFTLNWSKADGFGTVVFSNPDQTNTTASFGANGIYVLRLTASDGLAEASSDVTVTVNSPPIVDAGSDQVVTNLTVTLTGTAADDGLPLGAVATAFWTKVDGPGAVTFGNPASPMTTATFSLPGLYLLRLTSSDSLAATFDEVIISIDAASGSLDADGDGLPNDWEIRHGLNPFSALGADGANGDMDGDGVSNLLEYQQGRNPRVAGAVPDTSGVIKLQVYTPLE